MKITKTYKNLLLNAEYFIDLSNKKHPLSILYSVADKICVDKTSLNSKKLFTSLKNKDEYVKDCGRFCFDPSEDFESLLMNDIIPEEEYLILFDYAEDFNNYIQNNIRMYDFEYWINYKSSSVLTYFAYDEEKKESIDILKIT